MLRDEDIQVVKQSVTMRQIAEMYGYKVNRSGFMKCCFHSDKKPSMKVYDGQGGYNCFVCHKGGDIIQFVREHDHLEFEPAVRLIAEHFGIPIASEGHTLTEKERKQFLKRKAEQKAAEDASEKAKERLQTLSHEIHDLQSKQAQFQPLGPVWCWMQKAIERLEHEWEFVFESFGR